jgi:hypothetical protein
MAQFPSLAPIGIVVTRRRRSSRLPNGRRCGCHAPENLSPFCGTFKQFFFYQFHAPLVRNNCSW